MNEETQKEIIELPDQAVNQTPSAELVLTEVESDLIRNIRDGKFDKIELKSIDLESMKKNSVLVVKLDASNPYHAAQVQHSLVKYILEPRSETLRNKAISVLFMAHDDDIDILQEEDMNRAGWVKKDKPLIITPNQAGQFLP
jgi:hypothetical protein